MTNPDIKYTSYSKCGCGAITVHTTQGNKTCLFKNRKKFFPGLDLRGIMQAPMTSICARCSPDPNEEMALDI